MAKKSHGSKKPGPKPAKATGSLRPDDYESFLGELKERIQTAQLRAAVTVNRELVLLYWQIGRDILLSQKEHGWGAKVVDRLAADLQRAFPGVEGFSPRNLKYMRAFAKAWTDEAIVQQVVAQIPWGHNLRLLDMVKDRAAREWYARAVIENGWSRNVLVHWIESGLHERQGKATTNFERALPAPQSDLAREVLKIPTVLTFSHSPTTPRNARSNVGSSSTSGSF